MGIQRVTFRYAVTGISRAALLRDRVLGRVQRDRVERSRYAATRHAVASEERVLDAVFVQPAGAAARAVLLICHGIGEVVEHWTPVQDLLAEQGVASLVFDYSGYGRSTGTVDWSRCERDSIAAFAFLRTLMPGAPVSLLGFSLGSGIATAIAEETEPERLVLCEAFTSFRDAACSMGLPRFCTAVLPPIWGGEEPLRRWRKPVLIVHSARDRMFPVKMARQLAEWGGENAELVVVPDHAHNEPFYKPRLAYWGEVVARLVGEKSGAAVEIGGITTVYQ